MTGLTRNGAGISFGDSGQLDFRAIGNNALGDLFRKLMKDRGGKHARPWSGHGDSGVGVTLSSYGIQAFTRPRAWHLRPA